MKDMKLSWFAVQHCHGLLQTPVSEEQAVVRLAKQAKIQPTTARRYLRMALQLGLLRRTPGKAALVVESQTERAEDWLLDSPLVHFFVALREWMPPSCNATAPQALALLGIRNRGLIDSAAYLAHRVERGVDSGRPRPALLLALCRCWRTQHEEANFWSTLDAFAAWRTLLARPENEHAMAGFIEDCLHLFQRRLLVLDAVQILLGRNRLYRSFPTSLGYLRGVKPQGWRIRDAQPLSAERSRRAQHRRVAG